MAIIVPAVAGKIIHIGRAGENLATTVTFDVSEWLNIFGNEGTFSLFVQQGGASYYPQILPDDGAVSGLVDNNVIWEVTDGNTATVGLGKCELAYAINGVIVKSIIYDFVVTNSLDIEAAGNVPAPIDSWLNEVSQMTDQIVHAADYANAAERWAKGTENGEPVSSGDGYQDNSKYYSQQAETQKQLAARWADSNNDPSGTPTATNNARYFSDEAEQWAKGQINGVDVPSSHAGYHDNSKYYANQAAQWVTGGTTGSPSSTNNAKYYSDLIGHMTVNVETLEPGEQATVEVEVITQDNNSQTIEPRWNLDFSIPKGEGLKIDDQVNQFSDLPSAAAIGSVYAVGSAPTTYYFKKGTGNNWIELGIQGGTTIQKYIYTTNS